MDRPGRLVAAAFAVALVLFPTAPQAARLRPPPLQPPAAVVLEGEIDVGGVHSGLLELRYDGVVQATVPAAPGLFEIAMPAGAAGNAAMVSLEYRAEGVRLRSFLGGQARLALLAGAKGRLTPEVEDGLRLTPFTTAVAVLGASVDGVPPADDHALAEAIQAAWSSDFVVVATAIERLAVDPGRLPPGFDDGLALVEDVVAFNAVLQADPGLVDSPHLVFDALPTAPFEEREIAPVLVMPGPRGAPGAPPSGPALVMEREGPAHRIHGFGFDRESYSGTLHSGALALVPLQPIAYFAGTLPCPTRNDAPTWAIVRVGGRDLRRRWRGSGVSLWQLASDSVLELVDCPGWEPEPLRDITLRASPTLPRGKVHDPAGMLVGRQSLPLSCGVFLPHDVAIQHCGEADHVLARDGTGMAYPPGQPPMALAWGRDADGAMRFDYGEGLDQGTMPSRMWLIDGGDGVVQSVAWVAEGNVGGWEGTGTGFATRVRGGLDGLQGRGPVAAGSPAAPRYLDLPD